MVLTVGSRSESDPSLSKALTKGRSSTTIITTKRHSFGTGLNKTLQLHQHKTAHRKARFGNCRHPLSRPKVRTLAHPPTHLRAHCFTHHALMYTSANHARTWCMGPGYGRSSRQWPRALAGAGLQPSYPHPLGLHVAVACPASRSRVGVRVQAATAEATTPVGL